MLLEVCPRKQSGTWASRAANPGVPTDGWKKIGKRGKKKGRPTAAMIQRSQIYYDSKAAVDLN